MQLFIMVALVVKSLLANTQDVRDASSILGLERFPGEGNVNPLQYSCLGNPTDRGDQWATVHGSQRVTHNLVTKQQTAKDTQGKESTMSL